MACTFCTDEVRVKVPSFKKITLFLQYEIFDRDVIRLHICLFKDVTDYLLANFCQQIYIYKYIYICDRDWA